MFKEIFKLDLRSLALARVALGILTFFDIARRVEDIPVFFSDSGIISRMDLIENFEMPWTMGLLSLNGSEAFAYILALSGMIASLTFILGWKTRLSNLIVWLVITSFQARFPEGATSGGDMLIKIFLFWSFFLPMGAMYSFDYAVEEKKRKDPQYLSIFTAAWVMQVFLLYFFTFLYKWAPVYHTDFDAVWYMLQLDIFTTPFGKWMGQQYLLTKVLSFTCYALEIVGPLMLLIPWKRNLFRTIAVLSFWGFHSGIALTMHLGNFVPICLIIWMGLIPSTWWDYFLKRKYGSKSLRLKYLEGSLFSKQLAQIFKVMFFIPALKIEPMKEMRNENHFYLLGDDQELIEGSSIFSYALKRSIFPPFRILGRLLSSELSLYLSEVKEAGEVNLGLEGVHRNTGEAQGSRIWKNVEGLFQSIGFSPVKYKLNRLEKGLGAFLLALVIGWNIEGYVEDREWYIGSPLDEIMFATQLNQGWAMFAPHPQRSDGWWIMEGELKGGKKWDALNNKEFTLDRPEDIYDTYFSEDWRKFLDNLTASRDEKYLLALGKFLCRTWNSTHFGDESLSTFKLHFMQEWTNGPKEKPSEVKKRSLWNHSCF